MMRNNVANYYGDSMFGGYTVCAKTGTAQTGQFDESGAELLNYWFSGFWPAQEPLYTITILQDGVREPETSSAAIFAHVVEALCVLEENFDPESAMATPESS